MNIARAAAVHASWREPKGRSNPVLVGAGKPAFRLSGIQERRPQKARRARAQDADAREALLLVHPHELAGTH